MFDVLTLIEGPVLLWIQQWLRGPWLDGPVTAFSTLGNAGMLWLVLSVLMLLFRRTRKAGALGLVALVVGFLLCNGLLKPLVHRTRPWLVVEGLRAMVDPGDAHSFPSGHTCAAFAAAWTWRKHLPRRWMGQVAVFAAVLMGLSRLYLGVHFPTDVLAGGLVGVLAAQIVSLFTCTKKRRR